jgi:2-keto-3-deoxy-6-phosphogluconate aldolase
MNRHMKAILPGRHPHEAVEKYATVVAEGITRIEVLLNLADPLNSKSLLVRSSEECVLIRAGTVPSAESGAEVAAQVGR